MKYLSVALLAAITSLLLAIAVSPAIAGGITFDLPRLTYAPDAKIYADTPEPSGKVKAEVDTSQSCLNPTSVLPACPDQK